MSRSIVIMLICSVTVTVAVCRMARLGRASLARARQGSMANMLSVAATDLLRQPRHLTSLKTLTRMLKMRRRRRVK